MSTTMTQDTLPGHALFYSLLTFSSLHRYGLNQQVMQLKVSALHYLSASLKEGPLVGAQAVQHITAAMLVVSSEVSSRR